MATRTPQGWIIGGPVAGAGCIPAHAAVYLAPRAGGDLSRQDRTAGSNSATFGAGMLFAQRRTILMSTLVLALACLQLQGCSRQEAEWRRVRAEDSAAGYEDYLHRHPGGSHSQEAQERLRSLREDREWERAQRLNAPEAFQQYLGAYPEGRFAPQARERLADFLLAQAPSTAPEDGGGGEPAPSRGPPRQIVAPAPAAPAAPAPRRAVSPTPAVRPGARGAAGAPRATAVSKLPAAAPPARRRESPVRGPAVPVAGSGYRLQLGAFAAGEGAARNAWDRLHSTHGALLGSLTPAVDTVTRNGRTLWRLRAGPVDAGRAKQLCGELRARGVPCVVASP